MIVSFLVHRVKRFYQDDPIDLKGSSLMWQRYGWVPIEGRVVASSLKTAASVLYIIGSFASIFMPWGTIEDEECGRGLRKRETTGCQWPCKVYVRAARACQGVFFDSRF